MRDDGFENVTLCLSSSSFEDIPAAASAGPGSLVIILG